MRRSGMSSLCCDWPCKYPQVHVRLGGGACVRVYVCVRSREKEIWEKVVTGQQDRGQHPAHLNI